eukprot:6326001-Alexandrium_andersonii.AAC.1
MARSIAGDPFGTPRGFRRLLQTIESVPCASLDWPGPVNTNLRTPILQQSLRRWSGRRGGAQHLK